MFVFLLSFLNKKGELYEPFYFYLYVAACKLRGNSLTNNGVSCYILIIRVTLSIVECPGSISLIQGCQKVCFENDPSFK